MTSAEFEALQTYRPLAPTAPWALGQGLNTSLKGLPEEVDWRNQVLSATTITNFRE